MPKQTVRMGRSRAGPNGASRDMTLDIVSYGRRGPGGALHFGADEIAQIQRTVGRTPEVIVKVSGGGRDTGGVEAHLRYISRHGKLPIEVDEGVPMQGRGAPREIVTDWQLDLCRSQYKPESASAQKDNATPRQVRGQVRKPQKDTIHHRLRALRSFGQLPMSERGGRQPPKTSTFMRAKLDGLLQALQARRGDLDAGKEAMQRTRQRVVADWLATAQVLRKQGESELAAQVERLVMRMPPARTDVQRMTEHWKETERNRMAERMDVRSLGPKAR